MDSSGSERTRIWVWQAKCEITSLLLAVEFQRVENANAHQRVAKAPISVQTSSSMAWRIEGFDSIAKCLPKFGWLGIWRWIMGKPLSADLRERIVADVKGGNTRRGAASRFGVAASTAVRLQARYEKTGSVAPARIGRPRDSGKLGAHRDFIIGQAQISLFQMICWCWKGRSRIISTRIRLEAWNGVSLSHRWNLAGVLAIQPPWFRL